MSVQGITGSFYFLFLLIISFVDSAWAAFYKWGEEKIERVKPTDAKAFCRCDLTQLSYLCPFRLSLFH